MKASVLLGGTLLFLFFWNSSEFEQAVISACSDDWLVVRMKRRPFGNDTEVKVGEIHLGNNCPVTKMLLSNYEFSYSVINCGIKKIVFQESDAVILSKLHYKPTLQTAYEFEVLCFVKRLFIPSLLPFGMNGHDVNTVGNRSQGRERQQPPAASQDNCEPSLGAVSKKQFTTSYCNNNAYVVSCSSP
ncbi:oocyte-secreted protein 4B [Talpa occidentalis]|uniref:oocyte-secreted protein 4B n=1 Tax=Talpa occidentalis TaxID=50954 RepID=UPI00188F54EE|nr:oocyte-secreted protein 4B [Talpa occidentalis]